MKHCVFVAIFLSVNALSSAQVETRVFNLDSIIKVVESQSDSVLLAIQKYERRISAAPFMDTTFDVNMRTQSVIVVPLMRLNFLEEKRVNGITCRIYFDGILDSVDYIVAQALPSKKIYMFRRTNVSEDPIFSISYPAIQLPKIHFFEKMKSARSKGFFIYFFDREKYLLNVPALYKGSDELNVENPELDKMTDVFSLIEYRYGLYEKYMELVSEQRKDDSLGIGKPVGFPDMNLIKDKLRTNWLALVKYGAFKDSADLTNVFLSDITSFAGLSTNQTRLISRLIMNDLNPKSISTAVRQVRTTLNCYRQPYYNFLGTDISDQYLTILTKHQREQYEDHLRLLNYWLGVCENEVLKYIRKDVKFNDSSDVMRLIRTEIRRLIE